MVDEKKSKQHPIDRSDLPPDLFKILIHAARKARENAYAPYSSFKVGAAVLTESEQIFTGSNVENAAYGATVCAERAAVFKAVNAGHRSIRAVAVASEPMINNQLVKPCGICRQVISEFGIDAEIISVDTTGKRIEITNLYKIFPQPFHLDQKNSKGD